MRQIIHWEREARKGKYLVTEVNGSGEVEGNLGGGEGRVCRLERYGCHVGTMRVVRKGGRRPNSRANIRN